MKESSLTHRLNTIEDIIAVTNADNVDRFLFDFKTVLLQCFMARAAGGKEISFQHMEWTDDGKPDSVLSMNWEEVYRVTEAGHQIAGGDLLPFCDEPAPTDHAWTRVEDALPEPFNKWGDSEYVLCISGGSQVVAWYNHKSKSWIVAWYSASDEPLYGDFEVTHWRELPKPPVV